MPAGYKVDGLRLATLLSGKADRSRPEVFLMHYPHAPHRSDYFTSYRDGSWKVVYHYFPSPASGGGHYQLFHLGEDPFEQADLAMTHRDDLKRMMTLLVADLERNNAVYPVDPEKRTPLKPIMP